MTTTVTAETEANTTLTSIIDYEVQNLFPGYFALVMATGIVSIASSLVGYDLIALSLFWLNTLFFGILVIMYLFRVLRYFSNVKEDLFNHGKGPGFFTLIAGTNVYGSQLVVLMENYMLAIILWWFSLVIWIILIYTFFAAVTIQDTKPSLKNGINGAWLIAIVATQSVSILGSLITVRFGEYTEIMYFSSFIFYLIGCMLYILVISMIFYRFIFFKLEPKELSPPYWINMGAVAITTLAGATLMLQGGDWAFISELLPFIKGFTLFFWATGTWWIPLLFILGYWRHFGSENAVSFDYHPLYWGMVFPLGMYTACTYQLAQAISLDFLMIIPENFIFIALVAWLGTFWGLFRNILSKLIIHPSKN